MSKLANIAVSVILTDNPIGTWSNCSYHSRCPLLIPNE